MQRGLQTRLAEALRPRRLAIAVYIEMVKREYASRGHGGS